jgi:hypothetical protein
LKTYKEVIGIMHTISNLVALGGERDNDG